PTRALASPLRRTLRRPPRPALFPYTTLFRSEIVRVQPRFVEPPARRDHFFAGIVVQPRRPPAVAAVGNDLVTAAAHQEQVFILIMTEAAAEYIRGNTGGKIIPHPIRIVRKNIITHGCGQLLHGALV